MSIKTGLFYFLLSEQNKNKLRRTIHPKDHENFKSSKPRVQFYWFLKKECIVCLKKLPAKTIIVNTSIYFESYCKIAARSNKSITKSFSHKSHLHVKGILNQNKHI